MTLLSGITNPAAAARQPVATRGNLGASRIVHLKDGRRALMRAAHPGDAPALQRFVRGLSVRSRRNRFFTPVVELSADQLSRLVPPTSAGGFSIVAETVDGAEPRVIALAQYVVCEPLDAEFAVVVDDAWQRQGLGIEMLGLIAEHSARSGLAAIVGYVLSENWPMLTLLSRLGCEFSDDAEPGIVRTVKRFDIHEGDRMRARDVSAPRRPWEFVPLGETGLERAARERCAS